MNISYVVSKLGGLGQKEDLEKKNSSLFFFFCTLARTTAK